MQSEETETGVALYALDPPPQLRDVRGSDQARAAAAEFLNKPLVNVATGRTATVSGAALKKMLSQSGTQRSVSPQAHMMAVGNLDHLFAGAKLLRSRAPDKPGDAGVIEQLHHFEAPLPFQGKELRALMMAKEFTDASQGTRLYVVRAVTVEESEGAGVGGQAPMSGELRPGEDPGARPLPSAGESVPPDGAARDRLEDPTPGGLDMAAIRARLNSMPGAMSVQQTQAVVDRVTANWKGGFAVRVVATSADLPGRPSNARGRYVNGVGYIVANKHRTAQDVGRTLAHEVINHHGLRAMLGRDRWKQLMAQVRAAAHAGNPEVQAAQQLVRLAYRNADGSFMYEDRPELEADEIAARLIEASVDADGNMKPQLQWLKWVWAKLAEFMRSVGIDVPFTMAELHGVFVAARRNLEEDGQVLPAGMAVSPAVAAQDSQDALDEGLDARDVEIAGDTGRTYNPEQLAAMERVGFATKPEPLADRVKRLWGNAGKHLAQGIVDQFAPIKDISAQAYGLLRLSKGASGAFEVMLQGGQLKLSDGVYDFDDTKKGGVIDRLLMPLQGEHHDFLRWVAANRAEQLSAEDREHLFTPADIAALKSLADGTLAADFTLQHGPRAGQVTRSRAEAYADSLATFNEFNRNTMDMAEQSGLIDGASRALWEKAFYVPFYRVVEDGNVRGMNIKSGVVRQQAFKSLKGGDQKLNADLLENTLMNWAHLLDAAAKNRAAKATLEALAATGNAIEASDDVARQMAKSMGKPGGVVWFADGGRQRHFVVDDPYLMTAVSALEFSGMRSPIMQALGSFKHMLTIGVTVSPFFKVRNLIRDSLQAIGTAPLGANPLANVAQGWRATAPGSAEYFRLLAGGGTIHFGTMMEGSEAKRVQALVEAGVDQATILDSADKMKAFYRRMVAPVVDAYNELGNRGEAVNRAALYQQLLAQGKSHAEASLMARDLMDFSMQGSFTTVRFLTQVVPFMNARLQGLYKLGRGAAEDPARFGMVLGATALFSIGLLMAFGDDDDWKKREDWDRNNYWWFKVGGVAFRVPKPFEIGAIATLAERSWEVWFNEEMTAKRYRHNLLDLLGDNLALNPVPQLVKPIIDVYANIDGFTGRPIETMGMERLRPDFRFTERTTMAARAASTTLNAAARVVGAEAPSPVQIDHMVRGYFGWLGSMIVSSADVLARPATEQPSRPTPDYWRTLTGSMVSTLEDAPSRYVSSVYEQAKALEQTYGTWRHMLRQGQVEEAQAFREQYAPELLRYRQVEAVKRAMTQINALRRQVEGGQGTPEEKRDRLRQLQDQQDAIARRLAPA
ncbi:MAG TPA: LPD38 domain-containing protein [Ramlibacter sp.]